MKTKLLITSDRFLEQDRKLAEMLTLGKGEPETIDVEYELIDPSKCVFDVKRIEDRMKELGYLEDIPCEIVEPKLLTEK